MKIRTDQAFFQQAKLTQTVANFWDQISEAWKTVWGPHIHHGYYDNDLLTPLEAQERLIEKLIEEINIFPGYSILDVGCGLGGSSIFFGKKYSAIVNGITLSQKQVALAFEQAQLEKLSNVSFKVEDALSLSSFPNNSFNIVWSLESCEQFHDKKKFIDQAYRVLKPGGQLMLATWCSDQEQYEGAFAKKYQKLCAAFDVPYMPTIGYYSMLLKDCDFIVKSVLDWSEYVAKSWDIGLSLVKAYSLLKIIKMSGWRGLLFTFQLKMMRDAFREHRIRYGVFVATKPFI